tara:strand:- start:11515 stop:11901 length:387 start_codon:yes stop_codon:yes gene_type:complete
MKIQAELNRQVFDKKKFEETINTGFTQLDTGEDNGFFDINLATLEDFWTLYEKFFYDIPKLGLINSHEYLAKESAAYAGSDTINDEIQALLDEIAELREENLQLRENELNTSLADAGVSQQISLSSGT